jgi:hypothetical protein
MTNNPKKPKYPTIWNSDLLINYYYKNNGNDLPLEQKYQFLQTKIAILLGDLHMLQPQEAWSCEITDKSELGVDFNKGCWLRTIVKNNKTSMSDIWISNIDLMISQEVKNSSMDQKDIDIQTPNPLNVFYTIHLLRTMLVLPNTKRLFVNRITGNPIPLSTYTSKMHTEMQKMGIHPFFTAYSLKHAAIKKLVCLGMELPRINKSARLAMNSSVALSYYSPLAANNNAICLLITKDQDKQKEEVNNLLSLEKEKFEEKSPMNEEEREYQDEYNKLFGDDQEIEDIIQQEKDTKNIKIKEVSQKGDKYHNKKDNIQKETSSIDPMRQSQKMLLLNTFNTISSDLQGNIETTVLPSPSFPK